MGGITVTGCPAWEGSPTPPQKGSAGMGNPAPTVNEGICMGSHSPPQKGGAGVVSRAPPQKETVCPAPSGKGSACMVSRAPPP
jgi:hypothetical protein